MTDREPRRGLARAADARPLTVRGLVDAIGGPLGIVESVLPALLFIVAYQVVALRAAPGAVPRESLPLIVVPPLVLAGLFVLHRAVRRQRVASALGGAAGAALSAVLVLVTGDARQNFVPGLWTNAAYGAVLLVSALVRWPLIGLAAGFVMNDRGGWRERPKLRVFTALTLLWTVLFAVRLAVELPLFLANDLVALGVAKIALGLPLYAPVLVLTIVVVQAMYRRGSETS